MVMNSADLRLYDTTCKMSGSQESQKLTVTFRPKVEHVVFKFRQPLQPGRYTISTKFQGSFSNKAKGFFRTSYFDSEKHKNWMLAATQMEPTDARRMFPCFDEPEYKATFNISATIDPDDVAISNAPSIEQTLDTKKKRKLVKFEQTPKMSTYLVALIVGKFVPTEPTVVDGVPIRIWCVPGKEKLTKFSHDLACKLLSYYKQYFDVSYPSKKLDLIAIPDFAFGAMENLGAITFQEDNLLVDDKNGSIDAKQNVAINVAHEMSHMWFGDLVTMKWWDDLWLNEAFAEWMSIKAVDKLKPEWQFWNWFALEREQAMLSDSLQTTRSIHFDVKDPAEIEQLFDEITYYKGASVLRMLERLVTEDVFRNGIRQYIKSHEFTNAAGSDLWSAISEASGKDITKIVHSWLYLEGFPLLTVNEHTQNLEVEQKRFVFPGSVKTNIPDTLWEVPTAIRSFKKEDDGAQWSVITNKTDKLAMSKSPPNLVNAGGDGYYRVKYSVKTLNEIATGLQELSVLERSSMLSDQFYLAIAGHIPISEYLNFTASYRKEMDSTVTSVFCTNLQQLNLLIDDSSTDDFAAFVRDRLAQDRKVFSWTTSPSDSDLTKRERALVLSTLGTIGQDKEIIREARSLAEKYYTNADAIDADLVEPMIDIVAYNGNATDYSKIENLFTKANTPEQRHTALMALGMFQDPALLQNTLKMSLTNRVQKQDGPDVIAEIMGLRAGRQLGWHFTRKHIIRIFWRFPEHTLRKIITAMNALSTEQDLAEVKAFFKKHNDPTQTQSIEKIIEAIEVRSRFRKRSGTELADWFKKNTQVRQSANLPHRKRHEML